MEPAGCRCMSAINLDDGGGSHVRQPNVCGNILGADGLLHGDRSGEQYSCRCAELSLVRQNSARPADSEAIRNSENYLFVQKQNNNVILGFYRNNRRL